MLATSSLLIGSTIQNHPCSSGIVRVNDSNKHLWYVDLNHKALNDQTFVDVLLPWPFPFWIMFLFPFYIIIFELDS